VAAWVDQTLRDCDLEASGPIEHLRTRPWSALARVPTSDGDVFFKADPPALAFEPALTLALARRRPDCIPDVVASNLDRSWFLMRDAGPQLREVLALSGDPAIWDELLPLYAGLQRDLGESVDELIALGTPDDRPENLRLAFEELLPRWDLEPHLPLAQVIEDYADLLGDAIPISVVHEEFSDNNIHLSAEGPVVIDWGEAVIGHPFSGLVVTMRGQVDRWGYAPGGPELRRLRDLYLEPWTEFAPLAELVELFELAYALGMISRALAWDRILAPLGEEDRADYAHIVPAWLGVFAETVQGTATLGT
jgi:Phosphotransferase enzyme family